MFHIHKLREHQSYAGTIGFKLIIRYTVIVTEHKMKAVAHIVLAKIVNDGYLIREFKINPIPNIPYIISSYLHIATVPQVNGISRVKFGYGFSSNGVIQYFSII